MIDDSLMVFKCLNCQLIFRRDREQSSNNPPCPVCGPKHPENGDAVIYQGPDIIRKLSDY